MAKFVKCPECNIRFDREVEEAKKVGRRYFHPQCYEKYKQKEKEEKKKESNISQEEQERRELISYIMKLFKMDIPNGWVLKQIKDFYNMGYTYRGMKSTLVYFHEIMGNPPVSEGIGIIPYVYKEAKEWYTTRYHAKAHLDKLIEEYGELDFTTRKTVRIQSKSLDTSFRKNKIDINEL